MQLFRKKDPLPLFIAGKMTEEKFKKALKKLTPADAEAFDLESWRDFIIDRNTVSLGHFPILEYLSLMLSLIENDELLVDIALKCTCDDIISTDAVRAMKKQESLQKVLEAFNLSSPFRLYKEYNGRHVYDNMPFTPWYRGGRLMYVLLRRIDAEHFSAACGNCGGRMAWLEDIQSGKVTSWPFYEGGNYSLRFEDVYKLAKERGFLE